MLEAKKFSVAWWIFAAMAAAICPVAQQSAQADAAQPDQPAQQAVARALHLSSADSASTLHVLRSALPARARVHLVSVQNAPGQRSLLLRMACDDARDCLPFYAVYRGTKLASSVPSESAAPGTRTAVDQPLVRTGNGVAIVEELSGMHLRTRGICLQPGVLGDRIRVRNLSTHRVLVATIAAPDLVKVER